MIRLEQQGTRLGGQYPRQERRQERERSTFETGEETGEREVNIRDRRGEGIVKHNTHCSINIKGGRGGIDL